MKNTSSVHRWYFSAFEYDSIIVNSL